MLFVGILWLDQEAEGWMLAARLIIDHKLKRALHWFLFLSLLNLQGMGKFEQNEN